MRESLGPSAVEAHTTITSESLKSSGWPARIEPLAPCSSTCWKSIMWETTIAGRVSTTTSS